MTQQQLDKQAKRLARLLKQHGRKIVFAESCTGGLISATLTRIPGISAWHCGSAVVYQLATKTAWLGIPARVLKPDDAVSSEVARQMAVRVLAKTPQADVAASVTGHLGPDAPPHLDGLFYATVVARESKSGKPGRAITRKTILPKADGKAGSKRISARRLRIERQRAATEFVLAMVAEFLEAR